MEAAIETLHKDMKELKREVHEIKELLTRDPELREEIVRQLLEARKTPKSQYVSHEEMRREFE